MKWTLAFLVRRKMTPCSGGDRANVAFAYLHARGFENVRIIRTGYVNLFPALMPNKVRELKQSRSW